MEYLYNLSDCDSNHKLYFQCLSRWAIWLPGEPNYLLHFLCCRQLICGASDNSGFTYLPLCDDLNAVEKYCTKLIWINFPTLCHLKSLTRVCRERTSKIDAVSLRQTRIINIETKEKITEKITSNRPGDEEHAARARRNNPNHTKQSTQWYRKRALKM